MQLIHEEFGKSELHDQLQLFNTLFRFYQSNDQLMMDRISRVICDEGDLMTLEEYEDFQTTH